MHPARAQAAPPMLLAALLAGCSSEQATSPGRTATELPPPPAASIPAPPPPPASSSSSSPEPRPPERRFVTVELAPTQGDLVPLLRAEFGRARGKGLKPFVEFYADWCEPCRSLARSMSDARMIDAFTGTYIVKLNLDDWQDKLPPAGFMVKLIPSFYAFAEDGRPTGRVLTEKAWGRSVPANMAGPLKAFFQG
jgi:thiol-disulfide isomerase/thioredoxin